MKNVVRTVAVLMMVLLGVLVVARFTGLYGFHYAAGIQPPPGLTVGQLFLSIGCCYTLKTGDLIVYREDGADLVRQVQAVLDDRVQVAQPNGQSTFVERRNISGKVAFKF